MKTEKCYTCEVYVITEDRYVFSGIQFFENIERWVNQYYPEGVTMPTFKGEGYIWQGENRIGIIREYR